MLGEKLFLVFVTWVSMHFPLSREQIFFNTQKSGMVPTNPLPSETAWGVLIFSAWGKFGVENTNPLSNFGSDRCDRDAAVQNMQESGDGKKYPLPRNMFRMSIRVLQASNYGNLGWRSRMRSTI